MVRVEEGWERRVELLDGELDESDVDGRSRTKDGRKGSRRRRRWRRW